MNSLFASLNFEEFALLGLLEDPSRGGVGEPRNALARPVFLLVSLLQSVNYRKNKR